MKQKIKIYVKRINGDELIEFLTNQMHILKKCEGVVIFQ